MPKIKTPRLVEWVRLIADLLAVQPTLVAIPADILQRSDFTYDEAWNYTGTLTLDVSKAESDLDFAATPLVTWTEELVGWYRNLGQRENSPGYANRKVEIEFAEQYGHAIERRLSTTDS